MNDRASRHKSFKLMEFGQPFQETVEPVPEPVGAEVVVRVAACGVCHSDLHLAEGYFDLGGGNRMDLTKVLNPPRTLGHEIGGVVAAIGPAAKGVAVGDWCIVFPWIGCGDCPICARGDEHLCARPRSLGTTIDGGFSNYVRVPHARYVLDYGDLPLTFAATLACSGLTAYSALRKAGPVSDGEPLMVIGAGGVGLAAIAIAKALHGTGPIVAETDEAKHEAARAAGADLVVNPADPETRKLILKRTAGGVANAIDFVGAKASAEFGLSVLRKGGRLIVVGLYGGALNLSLPVLPIRAITVMGSYVGSLNEMRELVELARQGALKPLPIATHPLDEVGQVMAALRAGRITGRAVLTP